METPGPIDLNPFDALLLDTECLMEMAFQIQNRAAAAVAAASLATASAAHAAASATATAATAAATAATTATATTAATANTAAATAATTATTPLRTVSNGHTNANSTANATADALAEARKLHVELEYSNGQLRVQLAKSEAEARQARKHKREVETLRRLHAEAAQDVLELRSQLGRAERKHYDREGKREREPEGSDGPATVDVAAAPLTRNPSDHTKANRHTNGSRTAPNDGGDHNNLKIRRDVDSHTARAAIEVAGAATRSPPHPSSPTQAPTVPEIADPTSEKLRRIQGINRKLKLLLQEERATHASRLTAERCKHERALRAYLRASVHALSALQSEERGAAAAATSSRALSPSPLPATAPGTAATMQQSSPPSAADDSVATSLPPPPPPTGQLKDPPQPPSREESDAPIPPGPSNGPTSVATGEDSPAVLAAKPAPAAVAATGLAANAPTEPVLDVPPTSASPQPCQEARKRPASPASPGTTPVKKALTSLAHNGHAPSCSEVAHDRAS